MKDDDTFRPVDAFDVSDDNPEVIARHLRLLAAEMRSGFEAIRVAFDSGLARIHDRLDDLVDDVAELRADVNDHERRIRALEAKRKAKK